MYLALKVLFNDVFTVLPVWVSNEGFLRRIGALMSDRTVMPVLNACAQYMIEQR